MNAAADAIRTLAALQRGGLDVRSALVEWPSAVPGELRPLLLRVARRIRLGGDVASATEVLGPQGPALGRLLGAFTAAGGDVASALDAYADTIERSERARARAAAAGSGARLSGRLVAALPLVFVPLAPRTELDSAGMTMLLCGALLSLAGMWWIERIAPRPDRLHDPVADAAELVAGLLAGGVALGHALQIVAASDSDGLRRAERLARIGAPWPDALARDPELASLAVPLRRALDWGVPASRALAAEAARRRAAAGSAFDAALARAAVLMTIPLALCVLPAYLLLAIVPYLRAV